MPQYIKPPAVLPPGSPVFAYLRDSGGEAQEQSVPQQEAALREYCHLHGLALVRIFKDIARSAGSEVGREQFQELIRFTEQRENRPAGLLLWNFARFARDFEDSSLYKSTLRKRGIVVHSLKDDIPAGRFGRVVEFLIDFSNEEKRHQTSEDVKRALASLVKAGYSAGGFCPRGYKAESVILGEKRNGQKRVVSKWVPDPALWHLVKLAWQLRAEGKGYGEITRATGGKLYTSGVSWHSFFANKTYLGIGKCGDLEVPDHHEAAITFEIWEAVKRIEADSPRHGKSGGFFHPRRLAHPALLTGLAFCIHCGAAMVIHHDRNFTAYACGKRDRQRGIEKTCPNRQVNARKADTLILDTVLTQILTPAFVEELLDQIQNQLTDTWQIDQDMANDYRLLDTTDLAICRLLTLAQKTGELDEITAELKKRKAEQVEIKNRIADLEAQKRETIPQMTPKALAAILQSWRDDIQAANAAGDLLTAKRLMSHFVQKIELGYNQARIYYTFPDFKTADEIPNPWGHSFYRRFFQTIFLEWE